ncbi:unnamed protein product [Arabidopsis halleri]
MSTAEADYVKAKTSVWWDIENCEVPRGWDAHVIAQNVSSALLKMNYCGPVSISAYGDTNLIPLHHQQALSSTGVALNHIPAGVKDASDKKILVDMLLWAIDNPAPANFLLISGDRDFSNALHQLRMRRYNILLAQPPRASVPLVAAAKDVWLWTTLATGGPPLTSCESSLLFNKAQAIQPTGSTFNAGDTKDHKNRGLLQETRKNMPQNGRGATGESSRLVNNGHCHVPIYEVPKYPVSEPAQSSKPTDSTSDSGDAKDKKTRENHLPRGSPKETRKNIPQNGKGATGENTRKHKKKCANVIGVTNPEAKPKTLIPNYEVSKYPVSEAAQSSKPTDSTSDSGDTKDQKTRENHSPRGSPKETRKNMFQNGRGATGENTRKHKKKCANVIGVTNLEAKPKTLIPNYEVSKYPVSEPAKSSKPTDSTSDSGDTKDQKTRENHFPRGSPKETRKNMFQNGRGATGENTRKHKKTQKKVR